MTVRDVLAALGALGGIAFLWQWIWIRWLSYRYFHRKVIAAPAGATPGGPRPMPIVKTVVHTVTCSHCGEQLPFVRMPIALQGGEPDWKPTCRPMGATTKQ